MSSFVKNRKTHKRKAEELKEKEKEQKRKDTVKRLKRLSKLDKPKMSMMAKVLKFVAVTKKPEDFDTIDEIRPEHFLIDNCETLKTMKRILQHKRWDTLTLDKLDNLLPNFSLKRGSSISRPIKFSKNTGTKTINMTTGYSIEMKNRIGQGAYGYIYDSMINRPSLKSKQIVVKINKDGNEKKDIIAFLKECILHNEMWCRIQNMDSEDMDGIDKNEIIPKIEFIGKIDIYTTTSEYETYYFMGMEKLDGDMEHYIQYNNKIKEDFQNNDLEELKVSISEYTEILTDCIKQVSTKLSFLQKHFKFMHRDLWFKNVMFKRNGEQLIWYIIDFGRSTAVLSGDTYDNGEPYRINKRVEKGEFHDRWPKNFDTYKHGEGFNKSHDLRMFIASLYPFIPFDDEYLNIMSVKGAVIFKKYHDLYLYFTEILRNTGWYTSFKLAHTLWHNYVFHYVYSIEDPNFTPSNILKNIQKMKNEQRTELIELTYQPKFFKDNQWDIRETEYELNYDAIREAEESVGSSNHDIQSYRTAERDEVLQLKGLNPDDELAEGGGYRKKKLQKKSKTQKNRKTTKGINKKHNRNTKKGLKRRQKQKTKNRRHKKKKNKTRKRLKKIK
tara:strand:- start:55 stop:1887 length:1833 start_codon:yes stop_codon:yes gene_type:complete